MDTVAKGLVERLWERFIKPWWPDPLDTLVKIFNSFIRLFRD